MLVILVTLPSRNVSVAQTLKCWLLGSGYIIYSEFSHGIIIALYIPPSANLTLAWDIIHFAVAHLQTQHLSAFIAIARNFNQVTIATTQYVSFTTREERTVDLLYANTKDAYNCSPLPPLGRSGNILVHLNPCYVPLVKSPPATTLSQPERIWSGMRTITGFRTNKNEPKSPVLSPASFLCHGPVPLRTTDLWH